MITPKIIQYGLSIALLAGATLFFGCATEDHYVPLNPPKVKFGEFKHVELKETILPERENTPGNQKNAKKIDELLLAGMTSVWPDIKVVHSGENFSKGGERILQMVPQIEHIKIVSTGARIWVGAMAGDSDLVMHVDYYDSATGEVIASPDFSRGNNSFSGNMSYGQSDNRVRDAIVMQIVGYTARNK